MQLPLTNGFPALQTQWKAILDPVLANPMTNMSILKNIKLVTGNNQIPHLLQQIQQGWTLVDMQQGATIYRYRAFDSIYLYLNSSAPATVSIGVF